MEDLMGWIKKELRYGGLPDDNQTVQKVLRNAGDLPDDDKKIKEKLWDIIDWLKYPNWPMNSQLAFTIRQIKRELRDAKESGKWPKNPKNLKD